MTPKFPVALYLWPASEKRIGVPISGNLDDYIFALEYARKHGLSVEQAVAPYKHGTNHA